MLAMVPHVDKGRMDRAIERLKHTMLWGTYGKGGLAHCAGTCPEHRLRWVRLIDCSSEHLLAILVTQPHITFEHRVVIASILADRRFAVGLSEESLGLLH
jgi:hypothetical protein